MCAFMVALPSASAYSVVTLQGARKVRTPVAGCRVTEYESWRIRRPPASMDSRLYAVIGEARSGENLPMPSWRNSAWHGSSPFETKAHHDAGDSAMVTTPFSKAPAAQLGMASPGGGAAAASALAPLPALPQANSMPCATVVGRRVLLNPQGAGGPPIGSEAHAPAPSNAHPWYLHTSLPSCALRVPRESGAERCGHASSATRHPRALSSSSVGCFASGALCQTTSDLPSSSQRLGALASRLRNGAIGYQARCQSKLRQ